MESPPLLALIAIPFVASVLAAALPTDSRNPSTWIAGLATLSCTIITLMLYPAVGRGEVVQQKIQWIPELGLELALRVDGFAWIFALLVSGIGFLVVIYSRYYIAPDDSVRRFYLFFLAFMGAMLGVVISGNLILLVVFWELTSIFSFLLIGYWHQNQTARDGARMALTVTGIGGLALLMGMLILGHIVGSYDLNVVLESGDKIRAHDLYTPMVILFLLGALTKSAQFPFQFWLPNAMAAPTPVSAYLHSATMVKAGVFLMARFWPVLANTPEWFMIVGFAGMASLVLGAYLAMYQHDLKGVLAYSTISHLGLITLLLSFGSPLGLVAAIFHMVNHATFKASLFMAAGIIDHETGTRDLRKLSGLYKYMPFTGTLAIIASASMAGVPLLNGFLSKEMFFAEAVETHANSWLDTIAPYAAVLASALAVTYSLRFIYEAFFGPEPTELEVKPHEPPFWMRFPILFLVFACLVVGIAPAMTIGPYLLVAVKSVLGTQTPEYSLSVWHGINLPLIMSMVALVAGILLYWLTADNLRKAERPAIVGNINGQRIFEQVMATVSWRWARWLESNFGTRRLQAQLGWVVAVGFLAGMLPFYVFGFQLGLQQGETFDPIFTGLWVIGVSCSLAAAYQAKYHRLAALIMLGVTGLVTCLTFVWMSAPDLAATQLVVEIVTAVLLLLGLRWLPKRAQELAVDASPVDRLRRFRDFFMAGACGLGMFAISYAVMTRPAPENPISTYFMENAYTEAGGKNVVNVILVDFRGFDTFGEITVLGIVALTVFALLRRFRPAADMIERPEQQRVQREFDEAHPDREPGTTAADYLYIPALVMHWMFPAIIALAAYLFFRGHDAPGGGFAAGVAMAAAFILQYIATGTVWVEDRLRVLPVRWIGIGLLTALFTGLGAMVVGRPFLESWFRYADIPIIGKVPMASALFFDLGVFVLVVGATVLMLVAIAHQSIRRLRAVRTEEKQS